MSTNSLHAAMSNCPPPLRKARLFSQPYHSPHSDAQTMKFGITTPLPMTLPRFDSGWKHWNDIKGLVPLGGIYPSTRAIGPLGYPEIGSPMGGHTYQKKQTMKLGSLIIHTKCGHHRLKDQDGGSYELCAYSTL